MVRTPLREKSARFLRGGAPHSVGGPPCCLVRNHTFARHRHRISSADIQMPGVLTMNPQAKRLMMFACFGALANHSFDALLFVRMPVGIRVDILETKDSKSYERPQYLVLYADVIVLIYK
jgi:hypothetical protein